MIASAFVTQVPFGNFEIEGLMDEEGNYYVAVPQIENIGLIDAEIVRHRHGARKVKSLLSKDFKVSSIATKLKTEFNSNAVNCITIDQLSVVIVQAAKEGNQKAQILALDLVGLSLHQLFSDAFGIKFEKEDRQRWLKNRSLCRKGFHPNLTRWLQADGCTNPKDYAITVNKFKACASLPIKSVDTYTADELDKLNNAEVAYNMARKLGHSHDEAIRYL